jgi:hypothetical protein
MTKFLVSVALTCVTVLVNPRPIERSPAGIAGSRGRVRCPRADLQPAPGRLRASTPRHYDRGARCSRWTGTGRDGESPSYEEAGSQEAWPEAESLAMKDSLGREPRWNADSRAPAVCRRGRARKARHRSLASVGVSPPIFFLSWLAETRCHPCALSLRLVSCLCE